MTRPFHTLPDIMELGLLVARIQNESGADRDIDAAVMALFFTRDSRFIGSRWADTNEPAEDSVWVNPLSDKWVSTHPREFTRSLDEIRRTMREFLPEASLMLQAPWEAPATALVTYGSVLKARTALTPERALLTAFLCLADEIQREAA